MDCSLPTRPCAQCVMLGKPLPLSELPFLICKISGAEGWREVIQTYDGQGSFLFHLQRVSAGWWE